MALPGHVLFLNQNLQDCVGFAGLDSRFRGNDGLGLCQYDGVFCECQYRGEVCGWVLWTASADEAVLGGVLRMRCVDPDVFEHGSVVFRELQVIHPWLHAP